MELNKTSDCLKCNVKLNEAQNTCRKWKQMQRVDEHDRRKRAAATDAWTAYTAGCEHLVFGHKQGDSYCGGAGLCCIHPYCGGAGLCCIHHYTWDVNHTLLTPLVS